jgi:predicted methyltransferase
MRYQSVAHKCPVCDGRGVVPKGFYDCHGRTIDDTSSVPKTEACRACGGRGIVWEWHYEFPEPPSVEPWVGDDPRPWDAPFRYELRDGLPKLNFPETICFMRM